MKVEGSRPVVRRAALISYHSSPVHEPGSGDAGGMTVYVRHLAHAFTEHGVAADVFTRRTSPDEEPVQLQPGVRVVPVEAGPPEPLPKQELPRFIEEFSDRIRALSMASGLRYDVVHSHYWQSGLAASKLVKAWGVPFVHSNHTLGKVKNAALAPGDDPEPAARIAGEEEVVGSADVLIASTDDEYSHLSCLYGADHDRLKILPPGVDHSLFRPLDRAAARRELGLPETPLVLYVGRIQPLKGLDLAIEALGQLVDAMEMPPRLMLVGGASGDHGGTELRRLRGIADRLGVHDRVMFMGPQPHERLPSFYAAADAVVVCSHSESFGFAALEAHACGRAVVGTPVGGLSHIVRSGRSGFLVADRDPARFAAALKTLLGDPSLKASFEQHAVEAVKGFDREHASGALLDLYDCLIEESSPEACMC